MPGFHNYLWEVLSAFLFCFVFGFAAFFCVRVGVTVYWKMEERERSVLMIVMMTMMIIWICIIDILFPMHTFSMHIFTHTDPTLRNIEFDVILLKCPDGTFVDGLSDIVFTTPIKTEGTFIDGAPP